MATMLLERPVTKIAEVTPTRQLITYEKAVAGLQHAVKTMGEDYIYPWAWRATGCRYFDQDQKPSCIVGHVLAYLGYTPYPFDSTENGNGIAGLINSGTVEIEGAAPGSPFSSWSESRTAWLLSIAQSYSDQGTPWGLAVKWAINGESEHRPTIHLATGNSIGWV
jgi:hypothetical protein